MWRVYWYKNDERGYVIVAAADKAEAYTKATKLVPINATLHCARKEHYGE